MGTAWDGLVDAAREKELGTFADAVLYTPANDSPAPYSLPSGGSFDLTTQDVVPDQNIDVSSYGPTLSVKASELQGNRQDGDQVTMTSGRYVGKSYRVITWDPDGQDGMMMRLQEV